MGLTLTNVDVVYGGVIQVLRSANLEVPDGKMVVLLGGRFPACCMPIWAR